MSDSTPNLFIAAILGLLLLEIFARRAAVPRPGGLAGERLRGLVVTQFLLLASNIVLIALLMLRFGVAVGPVTSLAGSLPFIGWARAGLDGDAMSAAPVVIVLFALSLVAISAQYIGQNLFRWRSVVQRLDRVLDTTGRSERIIRGASTIINGGFAEEMIYRALLPVPVYFLTGQIAIAYLAPLALFIVMHAPQRTWGLLNAAMIGFAASVLYLVTEQLAFAIAVHAVANAFASIVAPELLRERKTRVVREAIEAARHLRNPAYEDE